MLEILKTITPSPEQWDCNRGYEKPYEFLGQHRHRCRRRKN